jgi:hypothetical protein
MGELTALTRSPPFLPIVRSLAYSGAGSREASTRRTPAYRLRVNWSMSSRSRGARRGGLSRCCARKGWSTPCRTGAATWPGCRTSLPPETRRERSLAGPRDEPDESAANEKRVVAEARPALIMYVGACPRGDLNPESREISQNLGNFHRPSITAGARKRHAFRVPCASRAGRRAEVRAGRSRGSGRPGFRVLLPGGSVPGGPGTGYCRSQRAGAGRSPGGHTLRCPQSPGRRNIRRYARLAGARSPSVCARRTG